MLNPFRVQGRQRQAHRRSLLSPRFSSDSRVVSFLLVAAASEMGQALTRGIRKPVYASVLDGKTNVTTRVIKIPLCLWVLKRLLRRMRPALGEQLRPRWLN